MTIVVRHRLEVYIMFSYSRWMQRQSGPFVTKTATPLFASKLKSNSSKFEIAIGLDVKRIVTYNVLFPMHLSDVHIFKSDVHSQ